MEGTEQDQAHPGLPDLSHAANWAGGHCWDQFIPSGTPWIQPNPNAQSVWQGWLVEEQDVPRMAEGVAEGGWGGAAPALF